MTHPYQAVLDAAQDEMHSAEPGTITPQLGRGSANLLLHLLAQSRAQARGIEEITALEYVRDLILDALRQAPLP